MEFNIFLCLDFQKLNRQSSQPPPESQSSQPLPKSKRAKRVHNTRQTHTQASQPMTSTHEPNNMNVDQAGGSTQWQGGIHYESSTRNVSADILQPKEFTWKGKQCTTLGDLEAAARSKREKLQFRKPTSGGPNAD